MAKSEDEDDYKNDSDPDGYFAYKKLVSTSYTPILEYANTIIFSFSLTESSILPNGSKRLSA